MIDGLKLDVPGSDIREHLERRIAYHAEKAERYETQSREVSALMEGLPGQSADPRSNLDSHGKSHRERVEFFGFLVRYVLPSETYRLSQEDLRTLEYVTRLW